MRTGSRQLPATVARIPARGTRAAVHAPGKAHNGMMRQSPARIDCPLPMRRYRDAVPVASCTVHAGRRHRPGAPADARARRPRTDRRGLRARHRHHAGRPGARRLALVAPHTRRLGLQPARSDRPRERRYAAHGLVSRPDGGQPGRNAAGLRRRALHAEPGRRHPGHRRRNRRPRLGVPPGQSRRRHRVRRQPHHQPEHRDLRPAHHRHQRRQPRLRPRRRDRPARLGDADPRLHEESRAAFFRTDHRRRQGGLGTKLHAPRRPGRLRHHRPRRDDRRGGLAAAHRSGPGRAGRRDVGRRSRSRSACTWDRGWRRATTRR